MCEKTTVGIDSLQTDKYKTFLRMSLRIKLIWSCPDFAMWYVLCRLSIHSLSKFVASYETVGTRSGTIRSFQIVTGSYLREMRLKLTLMPGFEIARLPIVAYSNLARVKHILLLLVILIRILNL